VWTCSSRNIIATNITACDTTNFTFTIRDGARPRSDTAQERQELRRARAEQTRILRDAADKRAERLLLQFLNPDQEVQYRKDRYFEVLSKDGTRRYRIRRGWAGNVTVIDLKGREVEKLCIHPDISVPQEDNLLAQKLLLEADEEEFRRTANITRLIA
jgi:hypothetical protein